LSALLFGFSSIADALPRSIGQFEAARFLGGIAIGIASIVAPLYIAEVSPARIRGLLVSLNQMAIVTGILLAYLTNWFVLPRSSQLALDVFERCGAIGPVVSRAFVCS
jgi:SP family arabinose:H+ symporter-like MFS transporter